MREYETVLITTPNLSEQEKSDMKDKVAGLIKQHDGHLFYARSMGQKSLAYPINKKNKGVYTCINYAAANTQVVNQLERMFRLDETVLRFLTVVKAETVDVNVRQTEIAAKGEAADAVETSAVNVSAKKMSDSTNDVKKEETTSEIRPKAVAELESKEA